MRVLRCAEDLIFVVLERFDPRTDIRSMIGGIVRNSPFCCKKNAGQLRPQLLLRVVLIPKALAGIESFPIQSSRVSGPMTQFMKRRAVVVGGFGESRLRRKVNGIDVAVVERAVILIVTDARTGMLEDTLPGIDDLKFFVLLCFVFRHSFDLFCVEDRIDAMDHPARLFVVGGTIVRTQLRRLTIR